MTHKKLMSFAAVATAAILLLAIVPISAEAAGPTVKKVATIQIAKGNSDRLVASVEGTDTYSFIFEACAGDKKFYVPEIIISSDSQAKSVKLAKMLNPESCHFTTTKITAKDPNSIKGIIIEKSAKAGLITGYAKLVEKAKINIATEKAKLSNLIKSGSEGPEFSKKIQEVTDKIVQLRKALNDARGEYNKHLYLLNQ